MISGKWESNWQITTDSKGVISYVGPFKDEGIPFTELGPTMPGFINSHSHAFQYAMAGLTEKFSNDLDDFWSWRTIMYQLALTISPKHLHNIASMLYSEMLSNGYTHVVEFHYLHHQEDGTSYDDTAEMGKALLKAADDTGISITLVPIYYNMGGFGKTADKDQRRFICQNLEEYHALFQASSNAVSQYKNASIAIGAHSIRAVNHQDLLSLSSEFNKSLPFHIHISEQLGEVQSCLEYYGARPLEWFSNEIGLSERTHLVHATHINDEEIDNIITSGANVVLCPTTEGNLGDGYFPFTKYINRNGKFSIGSDSHIGVSPMEELRWMDYKQRLSSNKRNPYQKGISTGEELYHVSLINGYNSTGNNNSGFKAGNYFNAIVLDNTHPLINGINHSHILNTLIFHGDRSMISKVITRGEIKIENGHHLNEEIFRTDFIDTLKELRVRI